MGRVRVAVNGTETLNSSGEALAIGQTKPIVPRLVKLLHFLMTATSTTGGCSIDR